MGHGVLARTMALALMLAASTMARGENAVMLADPDGIVVGTLTRVEGMPGGEMDAGLDRAACLLDRRMVRIVQIRDLLKVARTDRAEAYRKANELVARCMRGKGWVTTFCGREGEVDCPVQAPIEAGDPEHLD